VKHAGNKIAGATLTITSGGIEKLMERLEVIESRKEKNRAMRKSFSSCGLKPTAV
jgi:hypothetical protein